MVLAGAAELLRGYPWRPAVREPMVHSSRVAGALRAVTPRAAPEKRYADETERARD
jgi:hypothetical protein